MPTYEYECNACGAKFELFQSITEGPKKKCAICGSLRARRLIGGGAGIIFKGSGFYQTDYRSKSYLEQAKKEKEAVKGNSSEKKSENAKSQDKRSD